MSYQKYLQDRGFNNQKVRNHLIKYVHIVDSNDPLLNEGYNIKVLGRSGKSGNYFEDSFTVFEHVKFVIRATIIKVFTLTDNKIYNEFTMCPSKKETEKAVYLKINNNDLLILKKIKIENELAKINQKIRSNIVTV